MSGSTQLPCRRWLPALAAALLCLVPALSARAGSYTYGSRQRTVNAGVLINGPASSAASDPAPYVFYILNQRADVKPFGWNIVNPRAPQAVTQDIQTRWGAASYTVGQPVYPNMAAYWEVSLRDTSADQLKQYDVLYLPFTGGVQWEDNEKLRRFVDGGGTLLIDQSGAASPSPFALFTDTALATDTSAALGVPSDGALIVRHPMVSRPFLLDSDDVATVGFAPTLSGLQGAGSGDFGNLFAPVIVHPASQAISTAELGGGQIVVTSLDIGKAINYYAGASGNAGAYFGFPGTSPDPAPSFTAAPTQDLKLLANAISLADIHPAESKSGHQNASGNDLPSFASAWNYPYGSPGGGPPLPPPGAAVWGSFVFVTDTSGTLHAFDAFPGENLTNGPGGADDGIPDYSAGTTYDEIWNTAATSLGTDASAPTAASFGGNNYVFVERNDGSVWAFDAVTGALYKKLTPSTTTAFSGNAPAPTVYAGRVYAGQATGSLFVYDLNAGASASTPGVLIPTGSGSEPVTASPAVGLIPDGTANDIVALVPTQQNLYTVILGARGDLLVSYPAGGPSTGYDISGKFRLSNLIADKTSTPASVAYNETNTATGGGASGGKNPGFTPAGTGPFYANWDVDFINSLSSAGTNLNLNQINAASYGAVTGSIPYTATLSPPALDRSGDFYYTDKASDFSYLLAVHDNAQFQNIQLKWRFRLPSTGTDPVPLIDADGVNYEPLRGFKFVGAPVVDAQGYVYVVATNGSLAAVLCFVANQDIYADGITGFDANRATFEQADEFNPSQPNQLRPGPVDSTLKYGQFTASGSVATFFNFGQGAGGLRQLAGNLSEPQPVTVIPPVDANDPTTASATPLTVGLHTNLAWMTVPFAVSGPVSGLSKIGGALFLTDGTKLYKLTANPTVGAFKTVIYDPATAPSVTPSIGTVAAAPSVGQGTMILNGTAGVSALTEQVTLIADNNRILETDSDGSALWAVDSTTRTVGATAVLPGSVTHVDFRHPTSLSAVTANDYLVADTGNNRCVRFDRAGDVLWELTSFHDAAAPLLTPGETTTLNQPTSVQMRRYPDPDTAGNPGGSKESYLIADSGNYRVLEVTDTYNAGNILVPGKDHVLTFVSHTYDQGGRKYRYGSATYFSTPAGLRLAALVTNTSVGLTAAGTLGVASKDSPGGSILLFDPVSGSPTFGQVTIGFTSFQNGAATIPMRNPRFLSLYTPPVAGALPFSFLYADDNGAFDLSYIGNTFTTQANGLVFLPANYKSMPTASVGFATAPNRSALPFVPTCVQRIGTVLVGGVSTPRYLITQAYSAGELGDPAVTALGGEIFEVDGANTPVGGYNLLTLSRPTLTGPLTQPTFAIRP